MVLIIFVFVSIVALGYFDPEKRFVISRMISPVADYLKRMTWEDWIDIYGRPR